MWWRYTSTPSNANRKRANAVSRIFLCNDFLQRNIDFDRNINLLDQASVDDALKTNPACISCHVSLDPLAGYFYGFWHYTTGSVIDVTYYHPEREMQWKNYSGVAPGYFGTPSYTLKDLGNQIASDNRTVECAVETVWSGLLRRPVEVNDMSELALHREAFLEGDLTMRSLVRSIVNSPVYRSGLTDDPGAVPLKMVTPDLLASQIEDLTGFRWTFNGFDVLRSDTNGYLTLAGGADGYFVTEHATHPNATLLLVQERLAEAAASYVVTQDQMNPGNPTLFHEIDFTETPETDQAAMTRQLQALHFRLFGTRIASDGEEVVANLELWSDLYEIERSTTGAWTGLLSALLRDPALLFY